jgi:hypothetical protein
MAIAGSGRMASGAGREMAGSGDAVTGVKSGAYSGLLASLRLKETLRLLLVLVHPRLGVLRPTVVMTSVTHEPRPTRVGNVFISD